MKQKFWKELKSRLCPRQTWLKDEACVRCQCCTKQFSFFRRKHHCRFCGKIFCSLCSDHYINGTYLGLSEKYVRHCQFCKQEIQKIKQDLNRLTYMVQDEQQIREEEQDQSGSSSDEDNCYIYIKHIFGSVQKEFLYKTTQNLDFEAKTFNRKLLERFVEVGHINKHYANSKILQFITMGVIESKMNILPADLDSKEDYMDINRVFSIKTITGEPVETMQLVKGIVVQKNFALKGMETNYENPQIIVIQNSLDEGIVKLKFEQLMTNVSSINQFLQQKIMRLNPDVVFVEKSINKQILKYCSQNRVSILSGFKKKELAKICAVAGIRNRIKNIWNIGKYQSNKFIGYLDRIRIKKIDKNEDPLIYLEKNVGIFTLVLSQINSEYQSTLKKAINILVKMHRHIELQKYLIYTDDQMWEQKESIDNLKLYKYSFIYTHVLETLKPPKLVFYKVCLSEKKISELEEKVYQFCLMKKKYYFFDVCGEGSWNQIQSYTSQDLTIGHFILIMATNFLKKCSYCGLSHRYRYYFNSKGVEMSAVTKKKRSEVQEIQNEQDLTIEKMRNYLKKYKQAFNVFSYFKCRHCPKIVTKKSKIGKNYLKNSFHYFLMLISSSSEIIRSETNSNQSLNQQHPQDCKHKIIDRYIQTSDILFKMQVFSLKKYKLDIIDLKTPQAASIMANNTVKFIEELIQKQLDQKKYFLDLIQLNISSLINYLDPYKVQPNLSQKFMVQIQRIEKLAAVIEKSINYLDALQEKQMKKVDNNEIKQNTDWTIFLREIAKIEYVIKVSLEILIASETKLQKYRKKTVQAQSSWKFEIQEEPDQGSISQIQKKINTVIVSSVIKQIKSQQSVSKQDSQDQLNFNEASQESTVLQSKMKKSQELKSEVKSQDKMSSDWLSLKRVSTGTQRAFYQLQSNTRIKDFLKQTTSRRYQMKKGRFLYFNLLNYKDHFSILAYGLNSLQFYEHIQRKNSKSEDSIKLNIIVTKQFSTGWEVKYDIDQLTLDNNEDDTEKRDSYELIAFFHRQFQEVRKSYGISYQTYIRSLACSQIWQNNSGGKSNSQFAKSKDSLLIIKTVKEQQFVQFQKFAQSYLAHINKKEKSDQDSFLAKIFGIYELTIKGKSFKCVVMQNMFFNIDAANVKVYDLKGSEINRLSVPTAAQKNPTGLDTNFKIDKNHQPYLIEEKEYRYMWQSLQDDIFFLSRNEVIDYSLLVIEKDKELRIGVIDFMRPYHFFEKLQKTFKQLKYGHRPTVLPPQLYASRFLTAFKQYFMAKKKQISSN